MKTSEQLEMSDTVRRHVEEAIHDVFVDEATLWMTSSTRPGSDMADYKFMEREVIGFRKNERNVSPVDRRHVDQNVRAVMREHTRPFGGVFFS